MKGEHSQKYSRAFAFAFVTRTLLLCIVPSVLFAFLGRWIDTQMSWSWPLATLGGLFLALLVVYWLVLREAARYRAFFS